MSSALEGDYGPIAPAAGGGAAWGEVTGDLEDQTDLQTALDAKLDAASVLRSYLASTVTYNNTASLADTALSVTVAASGLYAINLVLHTTSFAQQLKLDFAGTATITNFIGMWTSFNGDEDTPQASYWSMRTASAGNQYEPATGAGSLLGYVQFNGSIEVNGGGTFLLRGAQFAANASDTTILRGSTLVLTKMN